MVAAVGSAFLTEITSIFQQILAWLGTFVSSLLGTATGEGAVDLSSLLPLFVLGIGISLCMVLMKLVRKITWGS